jgi:hypothetical protein
MNTEEKTSSIVESYDEHDDQVHTYSLKISMQVSAFLNNYLLRKEHPEKLGTSIEDAIKYGYAIFAWRATGKDPFSTFVSEDPILLHYKKELENAFGLEILSITEHKMRRKALGNSKMSLQYGDLFVPVAVFKA